MTIDSVATHLRFHTTDWEVVAATRGVHDAAKSADARLCETYWFPLYALARRSGVSSQDASDAVQGFLADVIERGTFRRADASRGRFRSFLATSFRNWLSNERAHERADKRGGARDRVSFDFAHAEQRLAKAGEPSLDVERAFTRDVALGAIEAVLAELSDEYRGKGQGRLFERLAPALSGRAIEFASIAHEFRVSEGALRVALHRLRSRFRESLRARIARSLGPSEDPESELDDWFAAFSR